MKARFWIALAAEIVLFAALKLFDDWTLESMPIKFVVAAILCGLAYLLAASEFPVIGRNSLTVFWAVTILLRLLALPLAPSSEVSRYQADGIVQRAGYDPYEVAPDDDRLEHQIAGLTAVARADQPAGFAPGAEILFRILPGSTPGVVYKVLFGAIELLAIVFLCRLVDVKTAAWFAWNPLLAYSFAGAGHFDSVVLLGLVVSIYYLGREQRPANENWMAASLASASLGLAIAFRPIMIVLLLPSARALRGKFAAALLSVALPALASAAFHFPQSAVRNLFGDFNHVSRLNDLFWWLIEDTIAPNWHQQYYRYDIIIVVVAAAMALIFWRNWSRGMLWALGSAIILAPVLHAWYITWILPVATWRRAYAWHFLAVTIFAYYLFFNERLFALPWHAEPWLRGMILLPVLFALTMLALQRFPRRAPG